MMKLKGILSGVGSLEGELSGDFSLNGELSFPREPEPYGGAYEVTPSANVQTLETEGLLLTQNIKINPIPSCYGLIAWSGPGIRIS